MSVLIKGMDMPKYKGEHKDFDRYGCFLTVYKNGEVELHVFENNYTVEEIPTPHGDLIDKEPIKKFILDGINKPTPESFGYDGIEILSEIEFAPTIIEAEVSE